MRIEPRYWCTPATNSSARKSPTMQLVEGFFTDVVSGLPDIWPFAKMPGSNWYSDGSHEMLGRGARLPLSSSQDAFSEVGFQGVSQNSTCVFLCALRALRFCIGQTNKIC